MSVSLEELNKHKDDLSSITITLELEIKRLKDQLDEKIAAFERNSGALSMIYLLLNNLAEREKAPQQEVLLEENTAESGK